MNSFNMIVMTIAVVFLILILSAVGIIMLFTKNNNQIFPPTSSKCPDYWTLDTTGKCKSSGINHGTIVNSGPIVSGNSSSFTFDPSNPEFTQRGMTKTCGQKRWANLNKIEWDGVSNYNKC